MDGFGFVAGSEAVRAIVDTTELGDVRKGGEDVASVDGFGFVAVAGPNKNGPFPK